MFHIDAKFACVACDAVIYKMHQEMRMPLCREVLYTFKLQISSDVKSLPTDEALEALSKTLLKELNKSALNLHIISCKFVGYSNVKQIEAVT